MQALGYNGTCKRPYRQYRSVPDNDMQDLGIGTVQFEEPETGEACECACGNPGVEGASRHTAAQDPRPHDSRR